MRALYYEPTHDRDTTETVHRLLAIKGYRIVRDLDAMPDMLTEAWAMVTVEGDGSWTLHDGDAVTHLPQVDEFVSVSAYVDAIVLWLGDDAGTMTPADRAEAGMTWAYRRSQAEFKTAMLRDCMRGLEQHAAADPSGYRSGSPARSVRQEAAMVAEYAAELIAAMAAPVDVESAESARAEAAGVAALARVAAAARRSGGAS